MASAPIKPWEAATLNSSEAPKIQNFDSIAATPAVTSTSTNNTPPVPPRLNPRIVSNISSSSIGGNLPLTGGMMPYSSYGGYGSYGGSYGYGSSYGGYGTGYGGYGMGSTYGSYGMGGYGSGYGSYGAYNPGFNQPGAESRFIQLAEESSRPAFQSIESVIRTFSSMAMMLDQTFFAMTSSFRAVLSVADSFGRLRSMMQHVWTSFALFKAINWILRKLASLLRIYDEKKLQESSMNDAFLNASVAGGETTAANSGAKWPIAVFLGVIVSAPYIVSKMIGSVPNEVNEDANILFRKIPATYGYVARENHELGFTAGEMLSIYPDDVQQRHGLVRSGWVLAKNAQGKKGVVPINYLLPNKKSE